MQSPLLFGSGEEHRHHAGGKEKSEEHPAGNENGTEVAHEDRLDVEVLSALQCSPSNKFVWASQTVRTGKNDPRVRCAKCCCSGAQGEQAAKPGLLHVHRPRRGNDRKHHATQNPIDNKPRERQNKKCGCGIRGHKRLERGKRKEQHGSRSERRKEEDIAQADKLVVMVLAAHYTKNNAEKEKKRRNEIHTLGGSAWTRTRDRRGISSLL